MVGNSSAVLAYTLRGTSTMSDSRNDFVRLLEFSLDYRLDTALKRFPMFSAQQIRELYGLSKTQREKLLADRQGSARPAGQHRNPAQTEKMREQATDPSNR